jgi:HK97 family phage major capsid protein
VIPTNLTAAQIPALRQRLADEASDIIERSGLALSPEDDVRFREIDADLDELNRRDTDRNRRLEAIRSRSGEPGATESGDGSSSRYLDGRAPQYMSRVDPYEERNLELVRAGRFDNGDVISRARKAVEVAPKHLDTKGREHVEKLLMEYDQDEDSKQAPLIARHMLLSGSEEYHRQFREYCKTGYPGELLRANMSLTDSAGGYLVPFTLDPTIILTNAGVIDPIRQIATIKQTATDTASYVTSAGVTAGWTAESAEATDGNVTTALLTITPHRADSWVAGSYEILADSGFATQLGRLLADAKARLEGAAFATGNTGATRPRGIVAAVAAVTAQLVGAAATNALAVGDVYNTSDAMSARYQGNMSWLANKKIYSKIRQFDTAGGSAFWANLGMGRPQELLGAPAYEASSMESAITTAGLVLLAGDFSQFYVVDRIGMTIQYNPMVMGRTNSRPTGEAGYFAMWRVSSDVADVGAFALLQLNVVTADVVLA